MRRFFGNSTVLKVCTYLCAGLLGVAMLGGCGEKETASPETGSEDTVIEVKELKEDLSNPNTNSNFIENLTEDANPGLGEDLQKDPIYTLEKINEEAETQIPAAAPTSNLVEVTEVPALAQSRRPKLSTHNKTKTSSRKRLSLSQAKELYKQKKYLSLTRFEFTSNELPQLYYKASAYFQLAHQSGRRTRAHIEHVRFSKHLYSRIAETTRDPDLKSRSLLWLGILRWRFPAWNEDLEQQLAPLLYVQRQLKKTRVYNDALLYLGFVYETHKRYDKAYQHYRKLGKTPADDWVYDDKIRKFNSPQRVSRWYLQKLNEKQSQGIAYQQTKQSIPKRNILKRNIPKQDSLEWDVPSKEAAVPEKVIEKPIPTPAETSQLQSSNINTVDFDVYREPGTQEAADRLREALPEPAAEDSTAGEADSFTFD